MAAEELPPDPRAAGSSCTEVDHRQWVRLRDSRTEEGEARQVLRHELSGEEVALKTPGANLHYQDAFAYLSFSDDSNALSMGFSLLAEICLGGTVSGAQFVFEHHVDGYRCRWCCEMEMCRVYASGAWMWQDSTAPCVVLQNIVATEARPTLL